MGMKVNGSTGLTFPDNTTMVTGAQAVRAWVNFNGTGTVAIRASYNVTSITDNGTGVYTVNFTIAMIDTNYCVTSFENGNNDTIVTSADRNTYSITSTSSVTLRSIRPSDGAAVDNALVSVAIFR